MYNQLKIVAFRLYCKSLKYIQTAFSQKETISKFIRHVSYNDIKRKQIIALESKLCGEYL